jgi:AAA ATPase domain
VTDAFVGRERERAALEGAAARARTGEGSIVVLAGEAGVGKSMLARTALAGCDLELFEGFGVQDGASAYGPIAEALRAILHRRDGDVPSQLAVILPELGPSAPAVERATVFEAIRSMLAGRGRHRVAPWPTNSSNSGRASCGAPGPTSGSRRRSPTSTNG